MLAISYGLNLAQLPYPPPTKAITEYAHNATEPLSEPTSLAKEKEREPNLTNPFPAGILDVQARNNGPKRSNN